MLSEASRLLLKLKNTDEYCYILFSAFNKFAEEPFFPTFITLGLFKPFIDFLKLSNYSDLQNYIKKIGFFTMLFEVKEIL